MSWLDIRVRRGSWVAIFCSAGAIAAACGGNPSVTNAAGGDGSGAVANGGSGGSSASGNSGGSANTGNINVGDAGQSPNDPIEITALAFDPPTITLTLDGTSAGNTATYTLKATLPDDSVREVAAESLQFDRPDIASFVLGPPAVLTATGASAGLGELHAVYGGMEATAELVVNIVESEVEGTIEKPILDALGEADLPADATLKTLLYPYDKTVFPLGLASPQMMWNAPNPSGDVYRVHLEQKGYSYDYYSAVDAPARLRIPQAAWDRVTASNSGDALTLTVSRWDSVAKAAFSSATQSYTIAPESLRGAIYYWTASDTVDKGRIGAINQVYPGAGATPVPVSKGVCMGCHSVSADGTTMVTTIEDPSAPSAAPYGNWTGNRAWASWALPDDAKKAPERTTLTTKSGGNSALTPDGKYVVFGGRAVPATAGSKFITLGVTATGAVIADSGLDDLMLSGANNGVMMPAFSVDGKKLALVEAGGDLSDNVIPTPSVRIVTVDFDQASTKFDASSLKEVVKASSLPTGNDQLGYPAFSPDGSYIAYHTGKFSTGCHPNDCVDATADSGELWVSPTAGGDPIRLAAINEPPLAADHNSQREPTFCPVSRGGYSWVVFTSMRNWGNKITGTNINGKRRLWVAAVDSKLGTVDPSHPAFYVEGQDDETPNMRGFWALAKCIETPKAPEPGPSCTANFECCSGFCVDGQCVDKTSLSCAGVGDDCESAADCCNKGSVECVSGKCGIVVVPK